MIGSLFSGIGGLELGLEWAGLGPTTWQVERDEFCRGVLAKHWVNVDRSVTDVTEAGSRNLRQVEVICGGFPCQDVSAAGKGAGLSGARSGLWFEYLRIVAELRPNCVVVENVASGAKRWLPTVRQGLEDLGYRTRALGISAADVGAPHLRRRVFVLAADPERCQLREQQGRGSGPSDVADADSERCEESGELRGGVESAGGPEALRSRARVHPWTTEPDVGRVAHGVPHRVDRLKALGNAVVPECAYVAGLVLREWTR